MPPKSRYGRILIIASGTRGDAQPAAYLAGLLKDDHCVTALTHHSHFGLFSGVTLRSFSSDPALVLKSARGISLQEGGWGGMRRALGISHVAKQHLRDQLETLDKTLDESAYDLAIVAGMPIGAGRVLNARRIRSIHLEYWPNQRTKAHPSTYLCRGPFPLKTLNSLSWPFVDLIARPIVGRHIRGYLKQRDLPTNFTIDDARRLSQDRWLAYPPLLAPAAVKEDANTNVVGVLRSWRVTSESASAVSEAIGDWVEAGSRVAYVSLGSMTSPRATNVERLFTKQLLSLGFRVIVHRNGQEWQADLVREVAAIDHTALLPHIDLAVHHGGIGTTAACLYAQVPMVISPQWFDQFYWAHELDRRGLAAATSSAPDERNARNALFRAMSLNISNQGAEVLEPDESRIKSTIHSMINKG